MRVHVFACGSPKTVTLGENEYALKSVCVCVRRACFGLEADNVCVRLCVRAGVHVVYASPS